MGILDGKAAVVTGSGRGVGRGHALHLAASGARVVVNDIDEDEAQKVVDEVKSAGGTAVASGASVDTREGCKSLVDLCVAEFGRIDAMINNAGNVRDRSFLKMSDEEFDQVVKVHMYGTFRCAQEAARVMKEQGEGGSIVNTISAAHFGNFGQTNYAGSKGAIASFTYTWAFELARYGIRVNAISPMATTRMSATAKVGGKSSSGAPFMDPTANGPFVVYLCSDEANYITGQCFGTGGERVELVEHPKYGNAIYKEGGWDVESLQQTFKRKFGRFLEPVGLMATEYVYLENPVVPKED
jgi:3-oxoacyl-[acyl-carrier protein] reductase